MQDNCTLHNIMNNLVQRVLYHEQFLFELIKKNKKMIPLLNLVMLVQLYNKVNMYVINDCWF